MRGEEEGEIKGLEWLRKGSGRKWGELNSEG